MFFPSPRAGGALVGRHPSLQAHALRGKAP